MEEKEIQFTQEFMQERNFNYMIISNRIKSYYKKMFDIEIVNLFYKRQKDKTICQNDKFKDYEKLTKSSLFNFYILIKDNNKKILKYKLLKATYDGKKIRRK